LRLGLGNAVVPPAPPALERAANVLNLNPRAGRPNAAANPRPRARVAARRPRVVILVSNKEDKQHLSKLKI